MKVFGRADTFPSRALCRLRTDNMERALSNKPKGGGFDSERVLHVVFDSAYLTGVWGTVSSILVRQWKVLHTLRC